MHPSNILDNEDWYKLIALYQGIFFIFSFILLPSLNDGQL